jgi:signal peptidase I
VSDPIPTNGAVAAGFEQIGTVDASPGAASQVPASGVPTSPEMWVERTPAMPAPAHRPLWMHLHLPTVPEALASLFQTIVVALFLLTFVLQPYLIPSESMEHTLLVGDFLLVNRQVYAPAGRVTRWLMPYRDVARGDIVVFHHPQPHPYLVKRVVGLPGDRLRIDNGRVSINGLTLEEPYAAFEPSRPIHSATNFPVAFTPTRRWTQPGGGKCRASPAMGS